MSKTLFWLKWALINAAALLFGLWGGSRFGSIARDIAFSSAFTPSDLSRASFAKATTAGLIAGWLVVTVACLAVLFIAQLYIWNGHPQPEVAWWSIIGILLIPVGIGIGALASEFIRAFVAPRIMAEYFGYAVGGMAIGMVQWLVLRRRLFLVGSSMLTNAIALPVGLLAFQGVLDNYLWLLLVILGVLYFALAGLPLLWLSPKEK